MLWEGMRISVDVLFLSLVTFECRVRASRFARAGPNLCVRVGTVAGVIVRIIERVMMVSSRCPILGCH